MEIIVLENGSRSKLIAYIIQNNEKRELVTSEKGRDDLLNKIDKMNLSHLPLEFI